MATIQSTDLDFDTIKTNLKTYLQAQSEFAELAKQTVEAQRSIEAADKVNFDDYLAAIAAKYTPLCGEPS